MNSETLEKYCKKCKCKMIEGVQLSLFEDAKVHICLNCGNIEVELYAKIS